ncbi:hypothetical protein EV190_11248 [Actinorugispora endophytica]|uniref:Uncharacterized protein n=1 Tax=Actinorugispora endophytica TaxID=1605990 RepID=A0A4R6UXT3_9ACTN|nr:hypothetical protein EV190_11248 [Actinorugispora endophytica]
MSRGQITSGTNRCRGTFTNASRHAGSISTPLDSRSRTRASGPWEKSGVTEAVPVRHRFGVRLSHHHRDGCCPDRRSASLRPYRRPWVCHHRRACPQPFSCPSGDTPATVTSRTRSVRETILYRPSPPNRFEPRKTWEAGPLPARTRPRPDPDTLPPTPPAPHHQAQPRTTCPQGKPTTAPRSRLSEADPAPERHRAAPARNPTTAPPPTSPSTRPVDTVPAGPAPPAPTSPTRQQGVNAPPRNTPDQAGADRNHQTPKTPLHQARRHQTGPDPNRPKRPHREGWIT